jgi:hypothetical protein
LYTIFVSLKENRDYFLCPWFELSASSYLFVILKENIAILRVHKGGSVVIPGTLLAVMMFAFAEQCLYRVWLCNVIK